MTMNGFIVIPKELYPTDAEAADTIAEEAERSAAYHRNLAQILRDNPGKDWKDEGYAVDENGWPLLLFGTTPVKPSKVEL